MLNRFIGKKEEPSIEKTQSMMESRVEELTNKINDLDKQIKQNLDMANKTTGYESQRYKQKALMLLKQKKQHKQHLIMTERQQMNLQTIQIQTEQMKDYKTMYDTMEASNRQMKLLSKQFNLDEIEDIQDKMMDIQEDQMEFGDILSQDISGFDFNNLDEELAQLGDEMFGDNIEIPDANDFASVPKMNNEMDELNDLKF